MCVTRGNKQIKKFLCQVKAKNYAKDVCVCVCWGVKEIFKRNTRREKEEEKDGKHEKRGNKHHKSPKFYIPKIWSKFTLPPENTYPPPQTGFISAPVL